MRRRGKPEFRDPFPEQIVEFEHAALDPREWSGTITTGCEPSLNPLAQPLVLVVHRGIDPVTEIAHSTQFAARAGQAEYRPTNDAFARSGGQHLEKVRLIGIHVDAQIRQSAIKAPAPALVFGQVSLRGPHRRDLESNSA